MIESVINRIIDYIKFISISYNKSVTASEIIEEFKHEHTLTKQRVIRILMIKTREIPQLKQIEVRKMGEGGQRYSVLAWKWEEGE